MRGEDLQIMCLNDILENLLDAVLVECVGILQEQLVAQSLFRFVKLLS